MQENKKPTSHHRQTSSQLASSISSHKPPRPPTICQKIGIQSYEKLIGTVNGPQVFQVGSLDDDQIEEDIKDQTLPTTSQSNGNNYFYLQNNFQYNEDVKIDQEIYDDIEDEYAQINNQNSLFDSDHKFTDHFAKNNQEGISQKDIEDKNSASWRKFNPKNKFSNFEPFSYQENAFLEQKNHHFIVYPKAPSGADALAAVAQLQNAFNQIGDEQNKKQQINTFNSENNVQLSQKMYKNEYQNYCWENSQAIRPSRIKQLSNPEAMNFDSDSINEELDDEEMNDDIISSSHIDKNIRQGSMKEIQKNLKFARLDKMKIGDKDLASTSCSIDQNYIRIDVNGVFMLVDTTGITDLQTNKKIMEILPDQIIYKEKIGAGNGGVVHKGYHIQSKKELAIKIINIYDKEKRHQLYNELKHIRNYTCSQLLQCYGCYFQEGRVRLLLEYMDCGCLEQLIRVMNWLRNEQDVPSVPELVLSRIVCQILQGLRYLHSEKKQIHRDLKPGNILLNSEGIAKISDFGIAKDFDNQTQAEELELAFAAYKDLVYNQVQGNNFQQQSPQNLSATSLTSPGLFPGNQISSPNMFQQIWPFGNQPENIEGVSGNSSQLPSPQSIDFTAQQSSLSTTNKYFSFRQQNDNMPLIVMGPLMPPPSHLSTVAYVGTLSYMSPERLEGLEYSFPSDIWAVGMIVYEMVTGHNPYPATDKAIILSEYMKKMPAPNLDNHQGISNNLKQFVKICLQKDPDNRWAAVNLLQHPFISTYQGNNVQVESEHRGWCSQYKIQKDLFEQSISGLQTSYAHQEFL